MAFEFDEKVILMCIDGMRPDGFLQCGNPFIEEMMKLGSYSLESRTVFPSCTLPCHMSMFHSVPPERHGILSSQTHPARYCYEVADPSLQISAGTIRLSHH